MDNKYAPKILSILHILFISHCFLYAQEVEIINYSTNTDGQVELSINSSTDHYYILKVRHELNADFDRATSMTLGEANTTVLTEPLGAYPLAHYQVLEYPIQTPFDTDLDGVDDITEFQNLPTQSPLNPATPITIDKGATAIEDFETFTALSVTKDEVQWSEFLNEKRYVKFLIEDFYSDNPNLYFVHSDNYNLHADFANAIGLPYPDDNIMRGQVIFHPTTISNNATLGTYAFNFSNGYAKDFEVVRKTLEFVAANMPFLENNISYYVTENSQDDYEENKALYDASRIPILLEADLYSDINYWGLNPAEGFGLFRQMDLDEIPGIKDIVLYEALPNALPRVAGIMTSVIQTPLSHVNLRAIQNNIPNAFIRDPLAIDSIANLLDQYIYYRVEQDKYFIREATLEEVNDWFEEIRPEEEQTPPINLDYTHILPLDEIGFDMFDGFGAKCANLATMRSFGFPEGTIPNGFGVPFYFYQEFMAYNDFFSEIEMIINEADFIADRTVRDERLKEFRKKIKEAAMPDWMLNELDEMHQSFPEGTSVRCRSSTNNEDLPAFNGAGLYTSKTQHPEEGHISKSIKQVYASLWNLRAFEEREFYRVNHFITSMGVLCHPNFSDEKANGVGVSIDPIYNTENTFYLNSQLGEELITNPEGNTLAEEILLEIVPQSDNDYIVVQYSNLVEDDVIIMKEEYLDQMREFLSIIHDKFAIKYQAIYNDNFAMDIEYKITSDDQLVIKQARPWVSYILQDFEQIETPPNELIVFPNPAEDYIYFQCADCNVIKLIITDMAGKQVREIRLSEVYNSFIKIDTGGLSPGAYVLSGFAENDGPSYSKVFVKK